KQQPQTPLHQLTHLNHPQPQHLQTQINHPHQLHTINPVKQLPSNLDIPITNLQQPIPNNDPLKPPQHYLHPHTQNQ
ncbi:GA module-containing protein, partial [Staphylococcus pasteuri]|uniref:GA module-containing protein n=1 Tax=Staphylococcus pasteuri TaxID=45972 RepID=UPI0012B9F70D